MIGKCFLFATFFLSTIFAILIGVILVVSRNNDVWVDKQLSSLATTSLNQLPEKAQEWNSRGKYLKINGYKMFYILVNVQENTDAKKIIENTQNTGGSTLILIHGFPTSSFDYHRALDEHLIPLLAKNKGKSLSVFFIGKLRRHIRSSTKYIEMFFSILTYF